MERSFAWILAGQMIKKLSKFIISYPNKNISHKFTNLICEFVANKLERRLSEKLFFRQLLSIIVFYFSDQVKKQ